MKNDILLELKLVPTNYYCTSRAETRKCALHLQRDFKYFFKHFENILHFFKSFYEIKFFATSLMNSIWIQFLVSRI